MYESLAEQISRLFGTEGPSNLSVSTEDTPEPLPCDDEIEATISGAWQDLFGMLRDTEFVFARADIAWGFVHIFQRATEKAERRWDEEADRVRQLMDTNDGSEIATSELEMAIDRAKAFETVLEATETMRNAAARLYGKELGRSWQPLSGSRLSHRQDQVSALVDGRDYLRARTEKRQAARAPKGTPVVFAGGRFPIAEHEAKGFADNLFGTLAKIKARIPDMVLVHGGDSNGVDRFAASWADSQKVPQVVFHLERRHGNRAGFVRAERMLDLKPACVVALQGSGVLERLVEMARQRNIPVVDRRGPLCTRPEAKRANAG